MRSLVRPTRMNPRRASWMLALTLCACSSSSKGPPPPAVEGKVFRSDRKQPVGGAEVSLSVHDDAAPEGQKSRTVITVQSDARGRFVITGFPPGAYLFSVSALFAAADLPCDRRSPGGMSLATNATKDILAIRGDGERRQVVLVSDEVTIGADQVLRRDFDLSCQ